CSSRRFAHGAMKGMPCAASTLCPFTVIDCVLFPAPGSIDTTTWFAASSSSTRVPLRRAEYCAAAGEATNSAASSVRVSVFICLLRQRETVHGVARRDGHELPAADGITDRRGFNRRAGLESPEECALGSVERDQVSLAAGGEDHTARRRQHARGQRSLEQRELPHRLAVLGIDRLDASRTSVGGLRAATARILAAHLEGLRQAEVALRRLLEREIEPAGDRAVRRRLEVGGAA